MDKLFWTLSSAPGEGGRLPGMPFLNGGLFDDDEFRPLRKVNPPLVVRNATFAAVFDNLLEAFNFTVTEDTPLNEEVAVDPEMLGKVFESIVLHAEAADPDAIAPDKRKATGSYYTPRIVVHFICREALYQYFHARLPGEEWAQRLRALLEMDASDGLDEDTKDRLRKTLTPEQAVQLRDLVTPLKCCDPAVGSGAFPVGLLHELVNLRRILTTVANGYVDPVRREGSTWLHDTKEGIVQNCLFGVDIQQQAIEICRLRLWLSLMVDYDLGLDPFTAEKSQFSAAISRISQLPNLEMNFHRGDSLHDHISGVPVLILPNRASHYAADFKAIARDGEKLHRAKKAETKKKLRLEILAMRLDLSQRILNDELGSLRTQDSALDSLFGLADSAAAKRERLAREIEQLERALKKVDDDRDELERLKNRAYDKQFYPKLRKLEGADFDSPVNFAWTIDFPGIFGANGSGFDIIVGNPPFVTARNPAKRELWRQRWPLVCFRKYHLLCPFMGLSFGLLKSGGHLGFIVSNGFAKREFGRPLIEHFFPTVNLRKVVDCSGLMFPGHGTPTCLIFGATGEIDESSPVPVVGIAPGGGDLRTPPEDSELWTDIAGHHDEPDFSNERIAVVGRSREEMAAWPWSFDVKAIETRSALEKENHSRLEDLLACEIGFDVVTGANEIYALPPDAYRRLRVDRSLLRQIAPGELIRDWSIAETGWAIFPYDDSGKVLKLEEASGAGGYLGAFRRFLSNRIYFGKTPEERGLKFYEYAIVLWSKRRIPFHIGYTEIQTHNQAVVRPVSLLFPQTAPIIKLPSNAAFGAYNLLVGAFNSAAVLFWLKQVCFSKREADEAETDTYYVFTGGKTQQIPMPPHIATGLRGEPDSLAEQISKLSEVCSSRGVVLPSLALRKLFQAPGEAYRDWNFSLPGYAAPDPALGAPFEREADLREVYDRARALRDQLRAEMVTLQEEMDWLVYAAYGFLPENDPAVCSEAALGCGSRAAALADFCSDRVSKAVAGATTLQGGGKPPLSLDQAQRPFRLWAQAEGDFAKAVSLIPAGWPEWRRKLWEARLAAIRDNEHVRRIEQPVYKRRWDEQWKVGNRWRCGPVAYAAEFIDAFEWWLREKAEWWLEHKKNGGPVDLGDWTPALWQDPRVQAAWPVAAENYALLEYEKAREKAEAEGEPGPARPNTAAGPASFVKAFKRIIDDETVPEGIPWAVPYDELEKKRKFKVPAKVKSLRGKLNVPRERFHLGGKNQYLWAGLQFRE